MSINNFNYNIPPQEQPLDLRVNIPMNREMNPTGLQTTGRVLAEAMNLLIDQDLFMEVSDASIPIVSTSTPDSHFSSIFHGNFGVKNSPTLQKQARLLELKKQIIGSAKINSFGNIISLNFSKIFADKRFLMDEVFQQLDEIFGKADIYRTVKKIILKDNKLRQLPKNITKFTNLKSIDLSNNRFSAIPFQIYNFKKLKKLSIKNNSISYISTQIGRLKNLEELRVSQNNITSIHRKLFSLKKLHTLDLSENKLHDIPKTIHKLHNLETLKASSNNLFTIPSEIFVRNLEYLDLSNNHIDAIPNTIKNSRELRDINFDNNEIVNIPDEIGDLPHVTAVCLNDNATLRGFSDNLYELLPSCTVEIDNSGLPLSILSEIKAKSEDMDYNGPIFDFSMDAAEERIQDRLVESLYVYTNRNPPRYFNNLRTMSDQLEMWLNRIDWMSDFQNLEGNPALIEAIIDCIEYAEANAEYRKLFQNIIEGATATCGDGIALSIIDIGIAKRVLTFMESNQIVELSHFLLGTVFPRQILQKIAGQKITFLKLQAQMKKISGSGIDDVEVYLAYPILLKERLNLSININSMVTQLDNTGVTQEDLEVAALEVEKQRADRQACAEFLINNAYWTELLKKLHPKEYEAINEKSIDMMEESETDAEEYRRNSLIALSGIVL